MRYIILLLFNMWITNLYSQKLNIIDTTKIICSYDYKGVRDTLTGMTWDDLMYLQIGEKISKFYSYYTARIDSMKSTPEGIKAWRKMLHEAYNKLTDKDHFPIDYPQRRTLTYIYKNYPNGKMTVTDQAVADYYLYEDRIDLQDWKYTEDSTRTILGHECQMATCKFRGREWTAWFALDIPISDGPWKLCGLPGLIMEAYDKGYQEHFCINGLQEQHSTPIFFGIMGIDSKRFVKIGQKEFLKYNYDQRRNNNSIIEALTGIQLGESNNVPQYDFLEREEK